jgi:acetyltransferase-like isoleucine patch superfamily enzyme
LERPEAEPLAAQPRTNELYADERRRIVGGEEAGVGTGVVVVPGRVVVGEGLSCTHPVAGQGGGRP